MKETLLAYAALIMGVMWYIGETHEPKETINQEINYEFNYKHTTLHSPRPSVVWGRGHGRPEHLGNPRGLGGGTCGQLRHDIHTDIHGGYRCHRMIRSFPRLKQT